MKYKELTKDDFNNEEKAYMRGDLLVAYNTLERNDTFFSAEIDERHVLFINAKLNAEGLKLLNSKLEKLFNSLGVEE